VQLIEILQYEAALVGIKVLLTEDSYTSQASFLDRDEMPVYDPKHEDKPTFSGKRVKRGLYRASDGRLINDYNPLETSRKSWNLYLCPTTQAHNLAHHNK